MIPRLMTHIVAGYPDLETSEALVKTMAKAGVAFLEIQIPFSDPVADGPVIMRANETALKQGITPDDCLALLERLHQSVTIPLLFMTYYNIIFRYGVTAFCRRAAQAGAYGLIVPDIPYHEEPYDHFLAACREAGLHAIQVVSPLTPDHRLEKIASLASGFIYCVSHTGLTGDTGAERKALLQYLKRVRQFTDLPLAVGFGISTPEQVRGLTGHADIAVIGSQVIRLLHNNDGRGGLKPVADFLRSITTG